MIAEHLIPLAQAMETRAPEANNTWLGFLIIGFVLALVAALAYMLGRRTPPPAAEQRCPRCRAVRRGKFCAICGTKF